MTFLGFQLSQMSLEFLDFRNNLLLLYAKLLLLARGRRGLGRRVGHGLAASDSLVADMSSLRRLRVGRRERSAVRARLAAGGYADASEAAVREAATIRARLRMTVATRKSCADVSS